MKKLYETESEVFLLKEPDSDLVAKIRSHFNLTKLTSNIIASRGLNSLKEIESFLLPALRDLPDPFLFRDMHKVVERIYKAITNKESILVYGDYDVDGITSTALLINFFDYISFPTRYYIPNRFTDGYGLNLERLLKINDTAPFQLLITVDCGISNGDIIKELSRRGIDTIITDHHLAEKKPDWADSVLNPSIPGCSFPFNELAGVGVVFFMLVALRSFLRKKKFWEKGAFEPDLKKLLDIVCIGTIADMVPLKGINRILVSAGLLTLQKTENIGLRHVMKDLGLLNKGAVSPWEISFQIAPRFNAAGRLKDASIGVSLLNTNDPTEAGLISKKLGTLNTDRQKIEKELLKETIRKIDAGLGFISPYAIILWDDKWHEGVIGIVASKLVEKYGRPVALISLKEDLGKGSLRGIPGTDVFKALDHCHEWLLSFGGHSMAGGMKIYRSDLLSFSKAFSEAIKTQLNGQISKKRWLIDGMINEEGLPARFFSELGKLEPFGIGNPPPLLALYGCQILSKKLLKERHIQLTLKLKDGSTLKGIAFNAVEHWAKIDRISGVVGEPGINYWNGNAIPQIKVKRFIM